MVMGAQLYDDVLKTLKLPVDKGLLWTDSMAVLTWLRNQRERTKVFVANRRRAIYRLSDVKQWNYVSTSDNPADLGTRRLSPKKVSSDSAWLKSACFLYGHELLAKI